MARQNFNAFIIEGRLGRDAEVKTVGNQNMQVAVFSIAANMARNGSQTENTVWFQCSMFRNLKLADNLKKGTRVLVNGQLEINQGQDGKQYHGILVNSIEMLGGGQAQDPTSGQPQNNNSGQRQNGGFGGGNQFPGNDPFAGI